MNRQQKIEAIRKIKNGIPAKFALMQTPVTLLKLMEEDFYHTKDNTILTKDEVEKYFTSTDVVILENVSKEFNKWENWKDNWFVI